MSTDNAPEKRSIPESNEAPEAAKTPASDEATEIAKRARDAKLPGILRPIGAEASKKPEVQPESKPTDQTGEAQPDAQAGGNPTTAPGDESASQAGAKADPAQTGKPADGPYRRETKLPVNPRRVRGGVRMKRKEGDPDAWAEQRLWRMIEKAADGDTLKEGLEYARGGQTRRIVYEDGKAEASVQGRRTRAYVTTVTMPKYTPDQKAEVVKALGDQSRYAAKLLAGELPPSIEDVFVPIGLHLFPNSINDFELSCTCKEENGPWCKHVVCTAALLGEKLANDPFLIFELRGLPREHLVEGLRDFRALTTLGPGPQPVYAAHVAGLTDAPAASLEESLHHFWRAPRKGAMPSVPIEPPEVSHPLLRRLGQSPFQESKFPLVGLLATCYELIGRDALAADNDEDGEDGPDSGQILPPAPPTPPADPDEPPARPRAARAIKR